MLARLLSLSAAVLLVAPAARAQSDDSGSNGGSNVAKAPAKKKPVAKAARVPMKPKLPPIVLHTLFRDTELAVDESAPPAPAAPAEVVTMLAKTLRGSYTCTGTIANEGGGERTTGGKLKISTDLDGHWIVLDLDETSSGAAPYPEKVHIVRTFDDGARAWTSVRIDNRGTLTSTTADRADDQDVTWLGSSMIDGARVLVRAHDDRDDRAGTFRMWSEVSRDGQTYEKQYDLTCAK